MRARVRNRLRLLLNHGKEPSESAVEHAYALVASEQTSLAAATGLALFLDAEIECPQSVLTPRADSECLVLAALEHSRTLSIESVVDLGVGSGALLIGYLMASPLHVRGYGFDLSTEAVAVTERNLIRNGLRGRAQIEVGNWNDLSRMQHDVVLWNPPYVESQLVRDVADPQLALDGGLDGLECYRRPPWHHCRPGGLLVAEIGFGQAPAVTKLLSVDGIVNSVVRDLQGIERAIVCTRKMRD